METKELNYHEEIYRLLSLYQTRISNLDDKLRNPFITNMERLYLYSIKVFRDGIPLYGESQVVNLILNKAMRVLSREKLLQYPSISVDESHVRLVHYTKIYRFIPTMFIVDTMISRGFYPYLLYVDRVKYKDAPSDEKEKKEWKEKKNAQRFHNISFLDFDTLCTTDHNQFFIELYKLTNGLLPLVNLSTAHDGKHSLRMTLSLVDVLTSNDGIVKAYLPDSLFCVRLVHTKGFSTDEIILDAIQKMTGEYPRLLKMISAVKKSILTIESVKVLSETIMSRILFKRVWEKGIIRCKFQEEMHSVLVGKNLWDALLFIQEKFYHHDGITYNMQTSKDISSKVKKFNTERIIQKKVIFGAVFTACYDITLSKN